MDGIQSLVWREPLPPSDPPPASRSLALRAVGGEVWALAVLPGGPADEPQPSAVMSTCAVTLTHLGSLIEAPLRLRGIWLTWTRRPAAGLPYLLVARLAAVEAGVSWARLAATCPAGDCAWEAIGQFIQGAPS